MTLSTAKHLFGTKTSRVKCLDFHDNNQLLLASLFNGTALVIDSLTSSVLKTIRFYQNSALRTGRWIPKTNTFAVGGDEGSIIFYDYTKSKNIITIPNAHVKIVRSVAFRSDDSNEQLMLSCGDDQLVKLWKISKGEYQLIRTYAAHKALVMDVKWSLREPTTFASASYDGTVVFWEVSQEKPRFTQKVSQKCINCISFASVGDKSLFAASADDSTTYIIDMQTRSVVTKLDDHTNNVSRCEFHEQRPIIFTTSEDGDAHAYSITSFAREMTYSTQYKRIWALAISKGYPLIAFGCDDGLSVYKFKNTCSPMSLDPSGKHILIARINDIHTAAIKDIGKNVINGSEPEITLKEALTLEYLPENIEYSPNTKFFAVSGGGEWSIYSTLGFKAKKYGKGKNIAWCQNDSSLFAVLTDDRYTEIQSIKNDEIFKFNYFTNNVFGGPLLGIQDNTSLIFVDWESHEVIRKIEIKAKEVKWNDTKCAIRTKDSIFILSYNDEHENLESEETGYSDAFEVSNTYDVKAKSICWANGILLFTEGLNLKRIVEDSIINVSTHTKPITLVGYAQKEGIALCADSQRKLACFILPNSLLEFERCVVNGEVCDPSILPPQYRTRESRLMKQLGHLELALEVADNDSDKFEISILLNQLEESEKYATDENQFRRLASLALKSGKIDILINSLLKCRDYSTLLLIYKGQGMIEKIRELKELAENDSQLNVAFSCSLMLNEKEECVKLLLKSKRYAEACLFARSNVPEMISQCTKLWRENAPSKRVSEQIADPEEFPNLFEEIL